MLALQRLPGACLHSAAPRRRISGSGRHRVLAARSQQHDGGSESQTSTSGENQQHEQQASFSGRPQLLSPGIVNSSLMSLSIVLPCWHGIFGGGSGGGSGGGGSGGGGDWGWGSGAGGSQPLGDLAAAAAPQPEAEPDAADDAADEDEDEEEEEEDLAPPEDEQKAGRSLITEESEYDEKDAGQADVQGRKGTKRCVEVVVEGWPEVGALPKVGELKDMLSVQEGYVFDYQDIVDDRHKLEMQYEEYISSVDIRTEYINEKNNHQRVTYKFRPFVFEGIDTIEVKGATLMPRKTVDAITASCTPENPYKVDIGLMDKLRSKVEKWYNDRGLPFCYIGFFDGMDEGVLRAHVIEGKVNDVYVRYEKPGPGDETEDVVYDKGEVVPAAKIIEASGFKKGSHYHIDDGQDAINNIYACGLIEDINIEPEQDPEDPSKINIKVVVDEVKPKSVEMDLDWAIQLQSNGLPQLSRQSLIPGGTVEISHENLFGDCQSLSASLSASDWRSPSQDLGFNMSYTEPFYKPNTTRNAQVFNTRKMSPVFTGGAESDVPPVFVDRLGAKAWTVYCGGEDDKVEHALILQSITTCDQNGQTITKGTKVTRQYYADNGPPTTLSDTGKDVSLSYQGFAVLDDVQFVNGNQLGRRALFQVDQGLNVAVPLLGLTGGLFNRIQASYTQFMQLPLLRKLTYEDVWVKRKAPTTLVLHGRAGNCLGDMGSYDYFTLGGPYSVRGYSPGELGACRRFMEAAAEVRVPLKNHGLPGGTLYGFAEYGTDLGSSEALEGNPTEYYRKAGSGLGYGVGLKALGACRFEYARDCNAGTGTFFVHWGERY